MRGDGTVFERKGTSTFWIKYWHRGKQYREPGGKTEAEAKRKLKKRLREIHGDRFVGPTEERLTVDELLDAYILHLKLRDAKSTRSVESHAVPIRAVFGLDAVVDITADRIEQFIADRLREPSPGGRGKTIARATVNREVGVLKQALNLARKQGRLTRVPYIPRLREDNVREGFLEPDEFDVLVAKLPDYLQDVARLAYITGWRKDEVVDLRWRSVDRDSGEIRLRTSKSGHGRLIGIEGDLHALIERRWEARRVSQTDGTSRLTNLVFHRDGDPVGDFRKAWARACREADLPGTHFHDFRRSAIRNMIRAGVPERVVMEITGHRTRSTFDRYNITSAEDRKQAFRKVGEYVKEKASGAPSRKVVPLRRERSS